MQIQNAKIKFKHFLNYVFPIKYNELPKFLLLTFLMFSILCVQNLVRAMKDTIINTMVASEAIGFLKLLVLPSAFLMTIIYIKLVNKVKNEHVFYIIISGFMTFFAIFVFYLLPNHEQIHLSQNSLEGLVSALPNLKWFIYIISKWSFSLFYIIAELWSNVMFALLYWQFVNSITTIQESKRFYPLFGLLGQSGLFITGQFLIYLDDISGYVSGIFGITENLDIFNIQAVLTVVLILCTIAILTFWFINHVLLNIDSDKIKLVSKKRNMSVRDSFAIVLNSPYIRLIVILLVCYGMAINLVEGPWKAKAAQLYKNSNEYTNFIGYYLSYTGILTLVFVILGSNLVRKMGWFYAAIITPIAMLVGGLMFFVASNFDVSSIFMALHISFANPMLLVVTIGSIHNALTKSTKYTLFDSTKEMAYIPLDDNLKTEGKATADVIGIKLGKSFGAIVQAGLFMIIPVATYDDISPFLMILFTLVCFVWIYCTFELNKEYKKMCDSSKSTNNSVIC